VQLRPTFSKPQGCALDPGIARIVLIEQTKMVFSATAGAVVAATLFAIALAWYLRPSVDTTTLEIWLALKVGVAVPRVIHGQFYRRRSSDSTVWLNTGRWLLLLDGLVWGSAGVFLMPPADQATMTVVVATLSGVAAVAAFVLHAEWRSCLAYVVPMLLPCILYFLSRGDSFGLYGATAILTYLMLLLSVARQSARHVVELLALRHASGRMAEESGRLAEQLSDALAVAQEQSRSRDAFVANMSHELRTPLHGILGLTKMLTETAAGQQVDALSLIRRSGEHLLGLINNILEHSRLLVHGIDVNPQDAEISRVITDAVAMCMPSAVERRITLTAELALDTPLIAHIDPFRLRQIVLNLVGNSVKFTDAGHVRVIASEMDGGTRLRIVVDDTGIGMTREVMDKLFEPFSQGDVTTRRRFGGTGLGLNITRAICVAMGGDISCVSEPGRGSTFTVNLPLAKVLHVNASVNRPARVESMYDSIVGVVLLAEDNEVNALVAEYTLRRFGVEVERAHTGVDVVRRMCSTAVRPDLVFLDCQMPEMDGFEACRQVRAFEREHNLPRVPIVALTANVSREDREMCREAGMDSFLGKPFSDRQVCELLQMYLLVPRDAQTPSLDQGYAARLH
jgi:signal transduction histidine kinase/CheY-like chemotaxis protein